MPAAGAGADLRPVLLGVPLERPIAGPFSTMAARPKRPDPPRLGRRRPPAGARRERVPPQDPDQSERAVRGRFAGWG